MTAITRIALIGCGAIGTAVLDLLRDDPALRVTVVVVPAEGMAAAQKAVPDVRVASMVPVADIDLVVETAGP